MPQKRRLARLLASLLLVGFLGAALVWPPSTDLGAGLSRPAADYAGAIRALDALAAAEPADQNPVCRQIRRVHGRSTKRVLVYLHGFTNCPEQFRRLAESSFAEGANVFVLPGPYQGLRNVMTDEQARITAEALTRQVDEAIDIAQGLGDEVTVVGISGAANAIAWAVHHRPDLDHAILIAPIFGYRVAPAPIVPLAAGAALKLPNGYVWWDNDKKDRPDGPPYAYPRFSTRAMAEVLRVGFAAQALSSRGKPLATRVTVVTNAADPAADNTLTDALVARWRANGATNVDEYRFPAELHLIHDLIDPTQVGARVDLVYPVLKALIDGRPLPQRTP